MGYFGYAYVVEGSADANRVSLTTTVYEASLSPFDGPALFFWSEGKRPDGLVSLANGTLLCTEQLRILPGYPSVEWRGEGAGESEDRILIEEDFTPPRQSEALLFHFVLPRRFIPCPNLNPLITPSQASVILRDDYLTVTFVASGHADVKFWIRRLEEGDSFNQYDLYRLLDKPATTSAKASVEFNLGIVKFSFGDR
jgi:hypothetical protein